MVSADTIFSQFSTISTSFLAHMVGEMAQKPLKYEEHIYSKVLTPKNKNGQKHPILGHIDGWGGTHNIKAEVFSKSLKCELL